MNKLYKEMVIANIKKALSESKAAGNYDNQVLKGRAREIFVSDLLRPFISPNIDICTGIVIDSANNHSKQIDVILFNKRIIPPFLLKEGEGIIPYESVLSTIEVKSKLDREEVLNSVQNARSVKTLEPFFAEIKSSGTSKNSPACYIFSFDSDLKEKTEYERLKEVVDEVNSNEDVSIYVPISGLCIPDKCFLYCVNAKKDPDFKTVDNVDDCNIALEFLIHIIDTCNLLSAQRDQIYIAPYLRDINNNKHITNSST
jgi:hypothetical protein